MRAYTGVKTEVMRAYHKSICNEVLAVISATGAEGIDVIRCAADVEHTLWQAPPIEAPIRGLKKSASIFADLKNTLSWIKPAAEKFHPVWRGIADEVLSGETTYTGKSYRGLASSIMLRAGDASLLFSSPAEFGSTPHATTFALESAAYLHTAYSLQMTRSALDMYVLWDGCPVGVKDGQVWLETALDIQVSEQEINAAARLPRGRFIDIPTRDTLDAVRAWATTTEVSDPDFLEDCLSILRLGADPEMLHNFNMQVAALKLKPSEPYKDRAADRFVAQMDRKTARVKVSLQERQLDYAKVQDILEDTVAVDRAKLYGILEILVPKYMTPNTFRVVIGYADVRGEHAMFAAKKYKHMIDGWNKFRDNTIARELAKLAKLEGEKNNG